MTTQSDPIEEHPAFDLVRTGVPLTLLLDLALPFSSSDVLQDEPADVTWLVAGRSA